MKLAAAIKKYLQSELDEKMDTEEIKNLSQFRDPCVEVNTCYVTGDVIIELGLEKTKKYIEVVFGDKSISSDDILDMNRKVCALLKDWLKKAIITFMTKNEIDYQSEIAEIVGFRTVLLRARIYVKR